MLRNEEKSSPTIALTLNITPTLSHSQKWIESNKNLNTRKYPICKKIYELYRERLNTKSTIENDDNESFFKEAEKLFSLIRKSEDQAYTNQLSYRLNELLNEICQDAYNELESNSVALTEDIKEIHSILIRLSKFRLAVDNINYNQSPAYYDLYIAGFNLYNESQTLAYDILKSPSKERREDLKALNASLNHAIAVVSDPIKNKRNIALLKEDSRIIRDTPNHWAQFKGLLALLASAALFVAGLAIFGIVAPIHMGTNLPCPQSEAAAIGGSIGIGLGIGACFAPAIALLHTSIGFFKTGFHKPVSRHLNQLAEKAENTNKSAFK